MGQTRADQLASTSIPDRMGRYEILVPIASGGMGMVYLARALGVGGFEREVALKLLHPHAGHRDMLAQDLIEEAKLTAAIRHPNIVQVYDVDEDALGVFMAMEYVEGCSLAELLHAAGRDGRRLPVEVGLRVLLDALSGLHAAHELRGRDGRPLGLVHRDFSPHNILVGTDGTSKLADFGIAKAAGREGRTATGAIKGKLAYLAPEQIKGAPLDRRCDVWAAGVVTWEMIAGTPLYSAHDDASTMYRILEEPVPRLRAVWPGVPIALEEAVARALVKAPSGRCPSAAAFARTLESAGVEVAPAEEVAAHVRRVAGEALSARRARIAETLQSRGAVPAGGDSSGILRDAPAVTAPTRHTGSLWRPGRAAPTLGVVAVLAAGAGGFIASGLRPGASMESTDPSQQSAPVAPGAAVAAATASPALSVAAPTASPSSPGTAAPEPPAPEPEAPPAGSGASMAGGRSPTHGSAPPSTVRPRPAKPALPLADSPYQRRP